MGGGARKRRGREEEKRRERKRRKEESRRLDLTNPKTLISSSVGRGTRRLLWGDAANFTTTIRPSSYSKYFRFLLVHYHHLFHPFQPTFSPFSTFQPTQYNQINSIKQTLNKLTYKKVGMQFYEHIVDMHPKFNFN